MVGEGEKEMCRKGVKRRESASQSERTPL